MNDSNLKNKSIEQLQSNLKSNQITAAAITMVLTLFTVISIHGLIVKDNTSTFVALFAVVCTCWSIFPTSFSLMREIKMELELREQIR